MFFELKWMYLRSLWFSWKWKPCCGCGIEILKIYLIGSNVSILRNRQKVLNPSTQLTRNLLNRWVWTLKKILKKNFVTLPHAIGQDKLFFTGIFFNITRKWLLLLILSRITLSELFTQIAYKIDFFYSYEAIFYYC